MTPQDVLSEIEFVLRHTTHPQVRAALIHAAHIIRTLEEERKP